MYFVTLCGKREGRGEREKRRINLFKSVQSVVKKNEELSHIFIKEIMSGRILFFLPVKHYIKSSVKE
jgi:hypothetical protein